SSRLIKRHRWSPRSWRSPASRNASGFRCRKARWKSGEVLLKKRWLIILVITVVAVLALAWFGRRAPPEPVYQGRTLMAWARDMNNPDAEARSNALAALQTMGTNGSAGLIRVLEVRDPAVMKPFLWLAPKLPLWVRRSFVRSFKPFNATADRLAAVRAFAAFGTNAPVSPLIHALRDHDRMIATEAAAALGQMGKPAVPDLVRELRDSDGSVRLMACYTLGLIGPAASPAAPVLI